MGKINSKQKGKRGERELAHYLQDKGLTARRTQQFSGNKDGTSDVLCEELKDFHLEVKRVEKLNIYDAMDQAIHDAQLENTTPLVVHRRNRDYWKVTMKLDDFLDLLKKANLLS